MMTITTPALLFPAISLLMLAYTNRFIVIGQLIRSLIEQRDETNHLQITRQIKHLKLRILIIRYTQMTGIVSFILCTISMMCLLEQWQTAGVTILTASLVSLIVSLLLCLYEVYISGIALNIQLEVLKDPKK
ncbi:DUF2721 domain-containing protein [Marinicellulosiphila megalodicopiae]|uniref:DUF2721 domain-containing protein n=1 Tax=Marinicellulosiphila megalodicopiae TaxID=2724896 RepID=UPI003BB1F634